MGREFKSECKGSASESEKLPIGGNLGTVLYFWSIEHRSERLRRSEIRCRQNYSSALIFTRSFPSSISRSMDSSIVIRRDELPKELLLEIFSYLPLQELLLVQGTCHLWYQLTPEAKMPPERRDLLLFYRKIVKSSAFLWQRSLVAANLKYFDRKGFLESLGKEYRDWPWSNEKCYIPADYRMWIMEWPTRAALGCLWPGLRLHGLSGADEPCSQWEYFSEKPIEEVSYPIYNHPVNSKKIPCAGIHKWRTEYVILCLEEKPLRDGHVGIIPDGERVRDPVSGLITRIRTWNDNMKWITGFSAWREMVFERLEEEYAAKKPEEFVAVVRSGSNRKVTQEVPMGPRTVAAPLQTDPGTTQEQIQSEKEMTKTDTKKLRFTSKRIATLLKVGLGVLWKSFLPLNFRE